MRRTYSRWTLLAAGMFSAALLVSAPVSADETDPRVDATWINAQPSYPDSAQAKGEEGFVDIAVLVNARGTPKRFRIVQSTGYEDLDNAAVDAVIKWKFIPATIDGDAISRWTTVRIVFKLPRPAQSKPAT